MSLPETIEKSQQQVALFAKCLWEPDDMVELRLLPSRKQEYHRAGVLVKQAPKLAAENRRDQNVYAGANPRQREGGSKAEDVALARCIFSDWDKASVKEVRRRWESAGLPEPTLVIESGHGVHAYWRFREPITDLAAWSDLQRRLIAAVDSDKSIHDPPRIMRLPGFLNVKEEPHVPCKIVSADPNRRYDLAEIQLPISEQSTEQLQPAGGGKSDVLARVKAYMDRVPGVAEGKRNPNALRLACVLTNDFGLTDRDAVPLLTDWNNRNQPPLKSDELRQILENSRKYAKWPPGNKLPVDRAAEVAEAEAVLESLEKLDVEQVFQPECINPLATLHRFDHAKYVRVRNRLRGQVPLRDLDAAVKQRAKEMARHAIALGGCPYRAEPDGLYWDRTVSDGAVSVQLANFTARIIRDITEDDGAERRQIVEIEAVLDGQSKTFRVPGAQFQTMNWPMEHLGARAVVSAGFGLRDHARAAIQQLSENIASRTVFRHLGWTKVGGKDAYLHAGGAIGAEGALSGIEVNLAPELQRYRLPEPPVEDELIAAITATLGLLKVAPAHIMYPVLASVFRTPLGGCDFSLALTGSTGEGKSEMAALAQQHYGPGLDRLHLPGSWASTENALEGLAFEAKDALLVVDDFAPGGSKYDVQRDHRKADRLLRGQGNSAGRQRMRSNSSLRPTKSPRGMIFNTGEDLPGGQSLRARILALELGPGDVNWQLLTRCQKDAASGRYAQTLSGFIRWLAGRLEEVREKLKNEIDRLRAKAISSAAHRRTPDIVANLMFGWSCFLDFAVEVGAIDTATAEKLAAEAWQAIGQAATEQAQHQAGSDPVQRFRELISAALASGKAHVAAEDGGEPESPQAWGWRQRQVGAGDYARFEWQPQGDRIGWVGDDALYLDRDAAFSVVQKLASEQGESLGISGRTLVKRLDERGLLVSKDNGRLTVRRSLQGRRRQVLHLSRESLVEEPRQSRHEEQIGGIPRENGRTSRRDSSGTTQESRHETCQELQETAPSGANGAVGAVSQPEETSCDHEWTDQATDGGRIRTSCAKCGKFRGYRPAVILEADAGQSRSRPTDHNENRYRVS